MLRRKYAKAMDASVSAPEFVLLARAHSPEREDKAREILLAHGAEAVRVHEIEVEKRLEELPLRSLRINRWLGDEPLARL
jgi:hypothetical protein